MNQDTKQQFKNLTDHVRIKLTDCVTKLQYCIEHPADLESQLNEQIGVINDVQPFLNDIDAKIDEQPE